jgi:hypothetical protein
MRDAIVPLSVVRKDVGAGIKKMVIKVMKWSLLPLAHTKAGIAREIECRGSRLNLPLLDQSYQGLSILGKSKKCSSRPDIALFLQRRPRTIPRRDIEKGIVTGCHCSTGISLCRIVSTWCAREHGLKQYLLFQSSYRREALTGVMPSLKEFTRMVLQNLNIAIKKGKLASKMIAISHASVSHSHSPNAHNSIHEKGSYY